MNWLDLLVSLRCWLVCVAGWFVLLVGLRCWLVCFAWWFALLVDLLCWLVCIAGWFALRVGSERVAGGKVCDDELAIKSENPPME